MAATVAKLQEATTISKTTQTLVGQVIPTDGAEWLHLFLDYVKGDETGLDVVMNARFTRDGDNYPNMAPSESSGVTTLNAEKIRLTATGKYRFAWYVEGIPYVVITQGGSNNDGSPTGTLAAYYTTQ